MAYSRPRIPTPPEESKAPNWDAIGQGLGAAWDTVKAPFAGGWQGLSGKNKTFEEWMRNKKRKKRGLPTRSPNWLQRLIN